MVNGAQTRIPPPRTAASAKDLQAAPAVAGGRRPLRVPDQVRESKTDPGV
jgi:hypothetical protein